MKMNVLKRGAALGALMAFVITGSAMAAEKNHIAHDDGKEHVYSNDINKEYVKAFRGSNVILNGNNIVLNRENGEYAVNAYSSNKYNAGKIIIGSGETDLVDISTVRNKKPIWGSSAVYGIYVKRSENSTAGNDFPIVNVNSKNVNIAAISNITEEVKDYDCAVGIYAINDAGDNNYSGPVVDIKADKLNISAHGANTSAFGIWAVGKNGEGKSDNPTKVVINAKDTVITATSENDSSNKVGVCAISGAEVHINSNLRIDADKVIVTRGGSTININEDTTNVTQLNGDISFEYAQNSGTTVDANVVVNLTGSDSYWNGNTKVIWGAGSIDEVKDKLDVNGLQVSLNDGAQWNPEAVTNSGVDADGNVVNVNGSKYVALNKLTSNGGVINLENMGDQTLQVENLSGKDLTVNVAAADNKMTITNDNKVENLAVEATQEYSEKLVESNVKDGLQSLAGAVVDKNGAAADTVKIAETGVLGEITAELDENGKVVESSINEKMNSGNAGISSMASIALLTWRQENNDMNKRLGELRDSKGEVGIWTRMTRGESEFKSVKNQYNSYQIGYDEKWNDNWIMGGAVTYTEGKSSFAGGNGDNKHKGFSGYMSYLGDDGSFVDLVAKYAWLDHDFDAVRGAGSGNYDTNGYSLSAEYGKRFTKENGYWIEPQVELTYGKVDSASYMGSNKVSIHQSDMESLVGRVGVAMGKNIKHGNVYVRASYLYDFDGETSVTFADAHNSTTIEQDLGGGWFEVGVGTNINLSDTSHLYFDVEKTYGGETATPWQWNAGVRFSF